MTCICCGCKLVEHTCLVPGCERTFYLCTPDKPGARCCSTGNDGRCPACRRAKAIVPQKQNASETVSGRVPKLV